VGWRRSLIGRSGVHSPRQPVPDQRHERRFACARVATDRSVRLWACKLPDQLRWPPGAPGMSGPSARIDRQLWQSRLAQLFEHRDDPIALREKDMTVGRSRTHREDGSSDQWTAEAVLQPTPGTVLPTPRHGAGAASGKDSRQGDCHREGQTTSPPVGIGPDQFYLRTGLRPALTTDRVFHSTQPSAVPLERSPFVDGPPRCPLRSFARSSASTCGSPADGACC
jgi:hypothetical protein